MIRLFGAAALIAAHLSLGVVPVTGKTAVSGMVPPAEVNGWKPKSADRAFHGKQLYDYIDGGAELYLSYGFAGLLSRVYVRAGQPDITLDFFDMGSSPNAFGVFSQSREKIEKDAGQGSEYGAGQMTFWKDRYYVSIMGQDDTPEVKKAIFALAKRIADMIPGEGPLPAILDRLPGGGLVPESVRYFHHHAWLNSHYFIADKNILHINEKTEAVLAKYGRGMQRTVLLLVEYPNEKELRAALDEFTKQYLHGLGERGTVRIEDGRWTACRYSGRLLAVVFNAPDEADALRLIGGVKGVSDKK